MSDEISTSVSGSEGSAGSPSADNTTGETNQNSPEPTQVITPTGMAAKIAKHKEGTLATAKAMAAAGGNDAGGGAPSAKTTLNTSTGVDGGGDTKQPPVTPVAAAPAALGPDGKPLPATPAWAPNFKFKFMGEEKEIPENLRGLIKDAESEKTIRELHEKSMGLDQLKPRYQETTQKLGSLTKGLSVLDQYIERDPSTGAPKDLGKFLSAFKLTDKDLFDYTKSRLEYHQLPEDQRQRIEAEKEAREQASTLEQENATLKQQAQEYQAQQRDTQLRELFNHPTIAPVVARHPGGQQAFYRDVAQHAWFHEQSTGQDLTPEQAVLSYIQSRGLGASPMQNATAQAAPTQVPVSQPAPQAPVERAPTLPVIPSQGTSPAKKTVSSMKDLKKIRDQKVAEHSI